MHLHITAVSLRVTGETCCWSGSCGFCSTMVAHVTPIYVCIALTISGDVLKTNSDKERCSACWSCAACQEVPPFSIKAQQSNSRRSTLLAVLVGSYLVDPRGRIRVLPVTSKRRRRRGQILCHSKVCVWQTCDRLESMLRHKFCCSCHRGARVMTK